MNLGNAKFEAITRNILFAFLVVNQLYGQSGEKPNILWIVSEDNSPLIGAYGDEFATTPNIDKLAGEGFLYTHAYANAPVCAPARNTIITGVYANSGGHQHMRSAYPKSEIVRFFPEFLRKAGYYVTNNSKEDYNITKKQTPDIWDESSGNAHYKNRSPGQPFFAIFNSNLSHESSIHSTEPVGQLRHNPDNVPLPPYHPDTQAIRSDWAHYYDNIEDMDTWVGNLLDELEENGEAENTIVFYYSDHGGVLARSKRYLYETGTRVPFVVRIPKKYKHLWPNRQPGTEVGRIISFVDLAPTLLSLVNIEIPGYMQGKPFLAAKKDKNEPDYAFMFRGRMDERYDMGRAARDQRFRYIRNYMPYRIYGQHLDFLWRAKSIRSWQDMCLNGGCNSVQEAFWGTKPVEELYDTENDPWEVNNLASDPKYVQVLLRMREALTDWTIEIKDSGFIPEGDLAERTKNSTIYDYLRTGEIAIKSVIQAANEAVMATKKDIPKLSDFLASENSAIRYWGATGALILGSESEPLIPQLRKMVDDPSPNVRVAVSETLYGLGYKKMARKGFLSALGSSNQWSRTHALNAVDSSGDSSDKLQEAVIEMARSQDKLTRQFYDHRAMKSLLDKWKVDADEYGIMYSW